MLFLALLGLGEVFENPTGINLGKVWARHRNANNLDSLEWWVVQYLNKWLYLFKKNIWQFVDLVYNKKEEKYIPSF